MSRSSIPGLASAVEGAELARGENREGLADLTRVFFRTQPMSTRACRREEGVKRAKIHTSARGSSCLYLQQIQQRHRLKHSFVMFQQCLVCDSRSGHDVAEDALQHALTHRPVQAAVHHPPRTADEAQDLAVDGGNRRGSEATYRKSTGLKLPLGVLTHHRHHTELLLGSVPLPHHL